MEKIKFKTWADHWHEGKFYPVGSDLELTKEQYDWLCDATGKAREEKPSFWQEKIEEEIKKLDLSKNTRRSR
jgi:hypothetical protein